MKYILLVTKNKWLRVIDAGMFKTVISLEKEKKTLFFKLHIAKNFSDSAL